MNKVACPLFCLLPVHMIHLILCLKRLAFSGRFLPSVSIDSFQPFRINLTTPGSGSIVLSRNRHGTILPLLTQWRSSQGCNISPGNKLDSLCSFRHHGVLTPWVGKGLRRPAPRRRKVPAAETAGYGD